IAVDAATDILETERAICWLYDAESDTLEPTAVTDAVETQAVDAVGLSRGTDDAGPDDETRFTATDIPEDSQNENGHRLSLGPHGLLDVGDSEHTEPDAVLLELIETLAEHATTALDRVERTQDLRESERRYRAIFNQTYQFTGLMQPDGTLIEVNDTALEFGNLDPDDVLGKKLWNAYWFTHASEMQDRIEAAVELAATGEFIREEIPVRGGERMAVIDFSIRPITDDDGNVELLIPEGRDITELNERKEELKQERDYLRRTEELADVGGWEVDFAERSIRWTIGAKRLYEVDETFEPSFENASDYFHPDDWEAITDAITDCRETGTEFDIEVRMITALGQTRWVRLQGEAVSREDSGTIRGVVADITDRREREQRLMVLNRVLRHNLRNNLGVITAFSDHLESLLTPPERTASGGMYRPGPAAAGDTDSAAGADGEQVAHVPVSEARSYTERITDSANDLLSLAEKARNFEQTIERAERTQPIAVRPILTDLLTEYRETYPETTIEADIDPISLRGNAEFIRRAVGELLSNAVEHSDRETPSITVTAEKQADGQVAITVADDGSGIPEMEQEVLRSGEESSLFHGSGVGLWTVNWLVTRLGGQITITENEPRGTAVVLTLPAADD
ncbi:MAG: PAS domain S-box protein, partial [Natronomonas sp.]